MRTIKKIELKSSEFICTELAQVSFKQNVNQFQCLQASYSRYFYQRIHSITVPSKMNICTSNCMVSSVIKDKFELRGVIISRVLWTRKIQLLKLRETMQLLVNHQLILIAIQFKSISLEQICYKRSQGIVVTSLHCLLFSTSKNQDLKQMSKSATNIV